MNNALGTKIKGKTGKWYYIRHPSQTRWIAYRYYDDLVDDEKDGGTTTIILQGYSDEYDEFEDIFYFDPMEMSEEDEDFAKGGMMQGYNDRLDES